MKKRRILLICSLIIGVTLSLTACNEDREREQRQRLESAYEKELNNEPMSEEEYNALKSFHDWEDKQNGKTYDEWE